MSVNYSCRSATTILAGGGPSGWRWQRPGQRRDVEPTEGRSLVQTCISAPVGRAGGMMVPNAGAEGSEEGRRSGRRHRPPDSPEGPAESIENARYGHPAALGARGRGATARVPRTTLYGLSVQRALTGRTAGRGIARDRLAAFDASVSCDASLEERIARRAGRRRSRWGSIAARIPGRGPNRAETDAGRPGGADVAVGADSALGNRGGPGRACGEHGDQGQREPQEDSTGHACTSVAGCAVSAGAFAPVVR